MHVNNHISPNWKNVILTILSRMNVLSMEMLKKYPILLDLQMSRWCKICPTCMLLNSYIMTNAPKLVSVVIHSTVSHKCTHCQCTWILNMSLIWKLKQPYSYDTTSIFWCHIEPNLCWFDIVCSIAPIVPEIGANTIRKHFNTFAVHLYCRVHK